MAKPPPASLTRLANRLSRRTALRISVLGLTAELLIAFTTILPGAPLLPLSLPLLLFPGALVVHFRSVVILSARKETLRELLRQVPWQAWASFVGLFLACWWMGADSITQSRGNPTGLHGHYFLNDHGTLIPVSHSEYLHAIVLSQRTFTLIPAVFYALGVIVNLPPAFLRESGNAATQIAPSDR